MMKGKTLFGAAYEFANALRRCGIYGPIELTVTGDGFARIVFEALPKTDWGRALGEGTLLLHTVSGDIAVRRREAG